MLSVNKESILNEESNCIKPLHLNELNSLKLSKEKKKALLRKKSATCFLCEKKYDLNDESEEKIFLTHLLAIHKVVIADVHLIGDLKKYIDYWKKRFETIPKIQLIDICYVINTNTGPNDPQNLSDTFYLLSDRLPEEKEIRQKLNIHKLEKVLRQQEIERTDIKFERECLFCGILIGKNRSNLINHMSQEHNFNIGNADNIVYFEEFYLKLKERFDKFQCLFCNKIFYNTQVLKEHMRKKMHKCIDPKNKEFDKFYLINYLEYSKVWKDIKIERDENDNVLIDECDDDEINDWDDPIQTYFCLFCDDSFENDEHILEHMIKKHQFDLIQISESQKLSFYNQVKLINYIRRKVYLKTCFICQKVIGSMSKLREHLENVQHIKEFPANELWDQPEYYFSTFEDDNLFCLLDHNAYEKDECKYKVIPEEYDIAFNAHIMDNLKELKLNEQ